MEKAARQLAADQGLSNGSGLVTPQDGLDSVEVARATLALRDAEVVLLRERIEAQEREIERLHVTLQRLAGER